MCFGSMQVEFKLFFFTHLHQEQCHLRFTKKPENPEVCSSQFVKKIPFSTLENSQFNYARSVNQPGIDSINTFLCIFLVIMDILFHRCLN